MFFSLFSFFKRSIAARLSIALAIFSVPVVFVSGHLVAKQNQEIEFSRQELIGTHFLAPALKLHSALVNMSGKKVNDHQIEAEVKRQIALLLAETATRGNAIQVKPYIDDVESDIAALIKSKFDAWSLDRVVGTSQTLITEITERSNLILDPELDTFYLMELVALRSSPLIEQINSYALAKQKLLENKEFGDAESVAIQQGMLRALQSNFDRSLKAAVKAGGQSSEYELLPRLNLDVQTSIDRLISTRDASDIQVNSRAARQSILRSYLISNDLLVELLTSRIDKIVDEQRLVLLIATAMFLASLTMCLYLVRGGVVVPLTALTGAMNRVASGEHNVEPPSRDRMDEIGDMARALDVFRENAVARIQAEHAASAKAEFLAVMSHEIRTPMNGVLGMTQALASSKLDTAQRKMVKIIQESGDTLLALLNDILDMSKIEAGKLELETIPFAPARLLESARDLFDVRASQKGLQLVTFIEPGCDIWRLGDPARLRQVVFNLVSNAIKFTEAGTVTLKLGSNQAGHMVISIKDTGIGISPEGVTRLFSKFTQADSSHTRKFGGTGLGLSIAKAIIESMGGDIIVASEIGHGSCFTIVVPLEVTQARSDQEPSPIAPPPSPVYRDLVAEPNTDGVRVLVAEDNQTNRFVLQTLLAGVGITPVFAENGQEAIDIWQQSAFDVILMDMQMPIMDGLAAMCHIRKIEKTQALPRIPIVALTANAMPHQIREQSEAGADAHAPKPIQLPLLLAAMEDAIDRCDIINAGHLSVVSPYQDLSDAAESAA